ncbi:MAG: hypothetical protein ACRCV9_13380 [Burkholderiaceae bacterium]
MKRTLSAALLLAAMTACSSPVPQPATAGTASAACQASMTMAAEQLLGRKINLAPDTFATSSALPIQTVGSAASGRAMEPADMLMLERTAQGCQLRLKSSGKTAAVQGCSCQATSKS